MPELKRFILGEIAANCYFVADRENDCAFVVDPGDESSVLSECISDFGGEKLKYILLTHGHFDHIGYAAALKKSFPDAKIVISRGDKDFPSDGSLNLSFFFGIPVRSFDPDIIVNDADELPFGDDKITVISTPGHTRGSVCFKYKDMLFTGDTLLEGTTGRMDFPTGSETDMKESVKKLAAIDEDLIVYGGHGASSDLSHEKKYNYAMRNL